jgi:hypothetical protein
MSFLQYAAASIFASTPNVGGAGLDLILILACLSLLVGMVYLFKFLLEKYHISRNNGMWQNHPGNTLEKRDK